MSTDRVKGVIVFICDDCDDHLETESADFAGANEARRAAGWAAVNTGVVWEHRCPGCKGGRRQPDFRSRRRRA